MTLKELRQKKGFNRQQDFADAVGVNRTVITNWETGQAKPKLDTIKKLAEILQVSVEEIIECF